MGKKATGNVYVLGVGMTEFEKPRNKRGYEEMVRI